MRHFRDGQEITIEPWRAKPFRVVRDLVVDRRSLDHIIEVGGFVSTGTGAAPDANVLPVSKEQAEVSFQAATCIGCGACVAACPNASAMLFVAAKASHLARLPQGQPERIRRTIRMVEQMDREGFGGCSNHYECEVVCPKEIPVRFIAELNREFLKGALTSREFRMSSPPAEVEEQKEMDQQQEPASGVSVARAQRRRGPYPMEDRGSKRSDGMTKGRPIRCFNYVNHPYDRVRDILKTNAVPAFSRATKTAAARAENVASQLHVKVSGIEVGAEIEISVVSVEETPGIGKVPPVTRVSLEWKAKESPQYFPLMHAELSVYPLTATETQLDFSGHYEPPFGVLGTAVDAVIGHRISEASIHSFVTEVAAYLRTTLS
jgi:ferredoxin